MLLLVFEPLCLHLFAATPGKWMLGITVRAWDGGKLSYREAYTRTRRVLIGGMGFYIPIAEPVANAIALWRSLKEREQPWDAEYGRWVTVYRPRRSWRPAACAVAYVLSAILIVAISVPYGSMPSNRGDMSAAEFSDNYNDLAAFLDFGEYERMTPDGLMTDMPPTSLSFASPTGAAYRNLRSPRAAGCSRALSSLPKRASRLRPTLRSTHMEAICSSP